MFEEFYKKNLASKGKENAQKKALASVPKQENTSMDMSPADYEKLDNFLKQAEQLKQGIDPTAGNKKDEVASLVEKFAGPTKATTALPTEVTYVQDFEMGDFVEQERLNVGAARGYKAVCVRIPIPNDATKESMKLEVTKNAVNFTCESSEHSFRAERLFKFELLQRQSVAKMKNFDQKTADRIGCNAYLEVTVNINHDAENTVKNLMHEVENIRFVQEGQSRPVEEKQVVSEAPVKEEPVPQINVPEFLKE